MADKKYYFIFFTGCLLALAGLFCEVLVGPSALFIKCLSSSDIPKKIKFINVDRWISSDDQRL